jgi:L-asparaginase
MTNRIKIIATGGTFDKVYNPLLGQLNFNGKSHLADVVTQARIVPPPSLNVLMLIDSLDMTDLHREQILEAVKTADEQYIVIVHGTDTMTLTATTIGVANLDKTVVITGAMVPVDIVASDAIFNLGFAIGCVKTLASGTYVAMNANIYPWNNVRKNREIGIFEKITP